MNRAPFRAGDWIVEPDLNRLTKTEIHAQLEPRLMQLLLLLADARGNLVSKDELLEKVWEGVFVSDESLSQAVSRLRKSLGDDPEKPRYIETIRKKGYRFLAPVEPVQTGQEDAEHQSLKQNRRDNFITGALVLAGAIFAALNVRPPETPPDPTSGRLLSAIPLTSAQGREADPGMSADGRYVAYTRELDDGKSHIFLHSIGRGIQDRQLTSRGNNKAPVFLPTGEALVFMRRNEAGCTLILQDLIDGAERIVGSCSDNEYPDTAINASTGSVLFGAKRQEDGVNAIQSLNLSDNTITRLSTPPRGIWGDYDPHVMQNGRIVVYARSVSEGMQDIYKMDLETGEETRLTAESRNIMGLSSIGEQILFASNRGGSYGIWTMDTDGNNITQLPITSARVFNPTTSKDGKKLVFESIRRVIGLDRINLNGNNAQQERLIALNANVLHPDISPTSGRIAFSSNRAGYYEIWDSDAQGGDMRQLTQFSSGFTAHPTYSPDGSQIAFDARPDGIARIYLMTRDGGSPTAISPADRNAYAPAWSEDGRTLFFAMDSADEGYGEQQLWRFDIEGETLTQLTAQGARYGYIAQDGLIYHTRPGLDGLWRISPDQPDMPELVSPHPQAGDWRNWAVQHGILTSYDRNQRAIIRMDLTTGDVLSTTRVMGRPLLSDPALAISPEGQYALIALQLSLEGDLEMVELP